MKSKLTFFVIIFILRISIEANCQDNFNFFKNKFDKIFLEHPEPLSDLDGDGIDDLMEKKLGTKSTNPDTDGDGLDDYLEVFKYKTNPLEKDSDRDGKIDSIWSERFEYSYVIKISAQVGKPFSVQSMNSFNLDAKIIKQYPDYAIVEYIVYPFVEPYLVPLKRTQNLVF